jgi:uncharacterized protein YciI
MQFDRHTLVLLVLRPDAPELSDEDATELQNRHLAFRADLRERGHIVAGGPLVDQDDERLRGVSIMACDPETARRLSSEDPAVQAGRRPLREGDRTAFDRRGGGRLTLPSSPDS